MKSSSIPDLILDQLIKVICSILNVHSIYLIGGQIVKTSLFYSFETQKESTEKQTYDLTFIIISKEYVSEPKEFMAMVFTKMSQKVKVYSIHYTLKEVEYRLTHGDNFLARILIPDNEIYTTTPLLVTGYCTHPKVYMTIEKEWRFRLNRAFYFEDKVDTCDSVYDETARMLLISQTLQQACVALLNVFWEYKPSYYDLHYLLNLCINFCSSPEIVFPKISFRSHKVYSGLCHAQYNVNFKSKDEFSMEESDYAHQICRLFLKKAEQEGIARLENLKPIHHKSKSKVILY